MSLTTRDAAAVALVLVSLASAGAAVTAPARVITAAEQAGAAKDTAVVERDQAVQAAEGDYQQAQAVADAAHDRAVAAARGDQESQYQAAIIDRDAAVADLEKVKDPSRESVRKRGDRYAEKCEYLSRDSSVKNPSPLSIVDEATFWYQSGVDTDDEGRCREAGDERIAADLVKAKADVAKRRKALAAVRDENAKTIAQIDEAAGPAVQQASQDRGQAVAQAQAQRDAAVQAAEAQAAPVIAAADEDIAAAEGSQTGTVIALWLAAVVAAAGAVWFGRRRLAQVPVRRAGGALTTAAVWLVQGWARAATWAVQQRHGGRLGRAFESSTIAGLQAGAFAPAELLKGSAMTHGWDARKPQKAVSGVRIALLVSVLTMAGMAIATRLGAPAESTVAESGLVGASYFLAHLVPLSWVVFGGPVAAVAAAGIGHALPLDAPMPPPAAPGAAMPVTAGPDGPGDPLYKSLKPAIQTAFGAYLTPATVTPIRGGHRHTWRLPPGLDADHVDTKVLRSHMSPLGVWVKVSIRHEQTVAVDVLDCDPKELPAIAWDAPRRSNFRSPMPVGETATGRKVMLDLEGARVAVIAKSGHGKTYLARMLALWAAQDPQVDLRVASLKGDPKLAPLRECASEYTGRKDLEAAERMIIRVSGEVTRRNVEAEDDEQGREAIDIFGPLALFVDEVHNITSETGRAALKNIAREGRQAGVTLIVATQESSKESLPSVVLKNCTTRFVGNFADAEYPRSMMGVPASVRSDNLVQGQWVLQREDESDWVTFSAAYVEDPEAAERAAAAAKVRAEHMPVVAQDVLPYAAPEAEAGCKRCGGPVPASKQNGFCSDACRKAFTRALKDAMNLA